jgi:hypothetical protein
MMFLVATIVDRSRPIPQSGNLCFNVAMHAVLISCRFLLVTVRAMLDRVLLRDDAYLRPAFGSQAMAKRLATGLRHVEAYLRRVLLVMALELEPTLVDVPRPLGRPKGSKAKAKAKACPHFCILPKTPPLSYALMQAFEQKKEGLVSQGIRDPQPVAMARLYERLDHLAIIIVDPLKRAQRLAFYLARKKPGPFFAPNLMLRTPGVWGTEARATFDVLAHDIITRSKKRPPPLQPPRRCPPSVTCFG